jgi:hypothetical protein
MRPIPRANKAREERINAPLNERSAFTLLPFWWTLISVASDTLMRFAAPIDASRRLLLSRQVQAVLDIHGLGLMRVQSAQGVGFVAAAERIEAPCLFREKVRVER